MKLYMGVTPDKYELPLFVADSLKELSKMSGFDYDSIRHRISKKSSGRNKGIKFIRIEFEEKDIEKKANEKSPAATKQQD